MSVLYVSVINVKTCISKDMSSQSMVKENVLMKVWYTTFVRLQIYVIVKFARTFVDKMKNGEKIWLKLMDLLQLYLARLDCL